MKGTDPQNVVAPNLSLMLHPSPGYPSCFRFLIHRAVCQTPMNLIRYA
jgi:hypothetical protein